MSILAKARNAEFGVFRGSLEKQEPPLDTVNEDVANTDTASKYAVKIKNLTVSFAGKEILNVAELNIRPHVVTMITGASGSGKSTLLRSINRLNECFDGCATTGEIAVTLDGKTRPVIDYVPEYLRQKAGMVFQHPNVLPVSIEKNFLLPLIHGAGVDRKTAAFVMEEKLKIVGLWDEVKDRLSAPANILSGGQQQRLCFARALSLSPEILLLDEPTSSLDEKSAGFIEDYIQKVSGEMTVVFVTHNADQAKRLGTDFVNMETINACNTHPAG
jgi:phosphate transport system ATP-binding protein